MDEKDYKIQHLEMDIARFKQTIATLQAELEELKANEPSYDSISYNVYDHEDVFADCTVQVWSNSFTGDLSFGWHENKWISVHERLPEQYTEVLVYEPKRNKMYQDYFDGYGFKEDISHWRTLPEPPIFEVEE